MFICSAALTLLRLNFLKKRIEARNSGRGAKYTKRCPFDLIFYAVKNTSKTSQKKKYALLLNIARMLANKGWNEDDRRDLFSFIVRIVNLTDTELQQKFIEEVKEDKMAELTFVEKYFRDEGREEGRAEEKRSIYERLVADGMSAQKASMMTGWNLQ